MLAKHLIVLLCIMSFMSCSYKEKQPNIVVILADDLGTGDVHCYNPNSEIPTPNLDKIANNGIRFTDAHSGSAVCTPTRYGIITGQYCWRSRLKNGVLNGFDKSLVDPNKTTIASFLKRHGYSTTGIGKWHLGMDFATDAKGKIDYSKPIKNSPHVNGFDYFYGISASLDFPPYVYIENDRFTQVPTEIQPKLLFPTFLRKGDKASNFDMETAWENLLQKAEYRIENREKQKPFFMYYALSSPHKPVWPDSRFNEKTSMGPYGDFVYQTDYIVGRVVAKLKEQGMEENTLLIVTSDNGSFMYRINKNAPADHLIDDKVQGFYVSNHEANYKYRGTKADIYEAGHRVPFLVQWPKEIESSKTLKQTICTTDFLATFADLLNIELQSNEGEDSFSFLPLLQNKDSEYHRAPVVNHSSTGIFAIRNGEHKLILGNGSGGRENPKGKPWGKPYKMFNLTNDLSEKNNIIEDEVENAVKMEAELKYIINSGTSK